ncbi:hypothetical protein BCR34DRAFT_593195 [Clohesyomyces aquaticus]|uniref:RING-type domain-containing protein n=1 Tax=Clohesyomyces aquaticus TaxID=1231657 RepID=A0A1Y1YK91_9PLEO|nr:hypothetical protein BCR34DRAFT_593195 [Clohesyomyces aquaticus]
MFPPMNPSPGPAGPGVGSSRRASESSTDPWESMEWPDDTHVQQLRHLAFARELEQAFGDTSGSRDRPVSAAAAGLLSIPGLAARRPSPDMHDSDDELDFEFAQTVREIYRAETGGRSVSGGGGRRGNTNPALEAQAPPSVANFLAHHTMLVSTHTLREDETTCVICLVNFGETDPESPSPSIPEHPLKIQLPYCKHIFGNKCLFTQVLGGSAPDERHCPLCKGPFWKAAPGPYDRHSNGGLGSRTTQSSWRTSYGTDVPVHASRRMHGLIARYRGSNRRQPESQHVRPSLVLRTVGDPPVHRPSANNNSGPPQRVTDALDDARQVELSNLWGNPSDHRLGIHPEHRNRSNTRSQAWSSARERGQPTRNNVGLLRPATQRSWGEQILHNYVDYYARLEGDDVDSTRPTLSFARDG